jgi:hypothetical protein
MEHIELKEFVRKTITDIEDGIDIDKRSVDGTIKFEICVSKTEKAGGNLKVFVASGGGAIEKGQVAKINFEVYPLYKENNGQEGELGGYELDSITGY